MSFNKSLKRQYFSANDEEVWEWANYRLNESVGEIDNHFNQADVTLADSWMFDVKRHQIRNKISRANLFLASASSSLGYMAAFVPLIIDKGNRLGFKYNSYISSDLNEQDGRAMGRTSYFFTASNGDIKYPVNPYIHFQHNYVNQMHRGTQNTSPGILHGKEWEDFSTASFYRIKVGNTDTNLRVERT